MLKIFPYEYKKASGLETGDFPEIDIADWVYVHDDFFKDECECPYVGVEDANHELWVYGAKTDCKCTMEELEWYLGEGGE